MSYVVLARKYRPMCFADMVGQEHIGRTLGNAIQQDRVHHAYLFSGARGLGKTTTARIFAKGLVCEQGPTPEPCNECSECVAVNASRSVDVMEIDGASNNSVDNIRNLREQVNYLPQSARRKVYIIDEVHMLTTSAFNALLKTLEEPPPHVNFVFATTEPQKVLPTILSRVNRLDFKRVSPTVLVDYLRSIVEREGLMVDDGGLLVVARAGGGSVRDALTLLDQVIAFAEDPSAVQEQEVRRLLGQADAGAILELLEAIIRGDPTETLRRFDTLVTAGHDLSVLSVQVLERLRDLTLVRVCNTPQVMPEATEAEWAQLKAMVADVSPTHLGQLFDRFSRVVDRLPISRSARLLVEMGLLDLACSEPVMPLGDLIEQLHRLGRGGPPPSAGGPSGASSSGRETGRARAGSGQPAPRSAAGTTSPSPPTRDAGPPRSVDPPISPSTAIAGNPAPPSMPSPAPQTPGSPRIRVTESPAMPPSTVATPSSAPPSSPAMSASGAPEASRTPIDPPAHSASGRPMVSDPSKTSLALATPGSGSVPPSTGSDSPTMVAEPPPDSFAAKLLSLGREGGMVIESAEAHIEAPAAAINPSVVAPAVSTPAATTSFPSMGMSPCSPRPPADGVIPWEQLEPLVAWEHLVERIRAGDEFLAAVLGEVGLLDLAGGVLRVASPRGSFAHNEFTRHPQIRAQVEQACRDHLGAPFTVELEEGEPVLPELPSLVLLAAQRRAAHRASVEAEAQANPGIQAILATFDGTLTGTKPLRES